MNFPRVSEEYRVIPQDTVNVLVPYQEEEYERLVREIRRAGRLFRQWIRDARPHSIGLYRRGVTEQVFLEPCPAGPGELYGDWFILTDDLIYDRDLLGLVEAPHLWMA